MQSPYKVEISPDDARRLAQAGASVLILNLPPSCVIGVDHQAFHAGPRFKGIKMIPPGIHFFSCRQLAPTGLGGSETSGAGCPVGFFAHLSPAQVVVKTYDAVTEQLVDMEEGESRRFEEGARRFEFDASLAPYDLNSYRHWLSLCSHLTPDMVSDLSPAGGMNISIMNEAALDDLSEPKTDAERELVRQLRQGRERAQAAGGIAQAAGGIAQAASGMEVDGSREITSSNQAKDVSTSGRCFYTPGLPSERLVKGVKGMTPAQLTQLNLDRSSIVLDAFSKRYGMQAGIAPALGEVQFAFIAFVFGQSLDGFMHWRALVTNLLSCEEAALDPVHQGVFAHLMGILKHQVSISIPDDAEERGGGEADGDSSAAFGLPMMDALLSDSFLKSLLGRFFSMIQSNSPSVQADLRSESQQLKQLLRNRLGWEFDLRFISEEDDADEDEPTIVDMDEALISF